MKPTFIITLLLITTIVFSQAPRKAEKVSVNGKTIYYECYGQGEPLFFFHGYTQSSKSWKPYVEEYINEYESIWLT